HEVPQNGLYCAFHGWVTCSGVQVQRAYLPSPAGSNCITPDIGCSSASDATRSLGMSAGHELLETMTDPFGSAWKDKAGAEIADKCVSQETCVSMPGGLRFQLQSMYSNASHACTP